MRCPRGRAGALLLTVGVAAMPGAPPARAVTDSVDRPRIVDVAPARQGDVLAANVRTEHLPGARILASLDSGLPSAIEMQLDVQDERSRRIGGSRVVFRVAYDLWDEVFRVEGGDTDERFADLPAMQRFLDSLPHLPVAPFASLDAARRHRIRVACRLHMIAPRETERLERWVSGTTDHEESAEGREVSVSLGDVIRFFYKGAQRDDEDATEKLSPWFVPNDLPPPSDARDPRSQPGEDGT